MDICPVCGKPHGKGLPNSPVRVVDKPKPEPQPEIEAVEEVGQIIDVEDEAEMDMPSPLGAPLEEMTSRELRSYAEAIGIRLPSNLITKAKMIELINAGGKR